MFTNDERMSTCCCDYYIIFISNSEYKKQKVVYIQSLLLFSMADPQAAQYNASKWGVNGFLGSIYEG